MIKSFFWSKHWAVWAWGGATFLLVSIYAQVHITVLLNEWYKEFYDLLQNALSYRNDVQTGIGLFNDNIYAFCKIAIWYVLLATITSYFTRLYAFRWREAMTFSYIPRWQVVDQDIEGSSQRIQEDCFRFTRIVETLGLQVIRAVLTLLAFVPILYTLSSKVDIKFLENVDGSLVWLALIVSIGGMAISWIVGIKLPGLEYNNQKCEATFRKELVLGEDDKVGHSTTPVLSGMFTDLKRNYHRLYLHYSYFDLWTALYDQSTTIMPYLIMAPGLFTGVITLGIMIQVSNAFGKCHASFALFIHNWTTITELRSIWKRLHEFEQNLERYK